MPVPQTLKDARTALRALREATSRALFAREAARARLEDVKRTGRPELPQAQRDFDQAQTDLDTARGNEQTGRDTLNGEIRSWLTIPGTPTLMEPDADYARMALTGPPVVLFPVRLETRFDLAHSKLQVRIYPDEFLSDIHERELTPEEQEAGATYWRNLPPPDDFGVIPENAANWAPISKRFGVPRAAYIVRATAPDVTTPPPPRLTTPSRGAEAFLPDRFVALAFKGGELRHMEKGLPIPEPLALTPDPSDDTQMDPLKVVEVADGFKVPASTAWTVNYGDALNKGMAIDIGGLLPDEITDGFDRVVVLGVKTSLEPEDATNLIADMFDGHHYTRGLDLVPQGTPSNNIPGRPTPFTMAEPTADESFQIERIGPDIGEPPTGFTADFSALANLFGYPTIDNVFKFTRGAVALQQDVFDGQNMRRVLWSSTLGYFMNQMMNPPDFLTDGSKPAIFSDVDVLNARGFFVDTVSPQGPAPVFRVGAVPYGILPAIAISRMKAAATGENATAIDVMSRLVAYWRAAAVNVPAVPAGATNRNVDLMKVISQKSHSDGVFIRNSVGVEAATNLLQFAVQDYGAMLTALGQVGNPELGTLNHLDWAGARIFELTFLAAITRHAGPLVTAHPQKDQLVSAVFAPNLPPDDTRRLNYLGFLGDTSLPLNKVQTQDVMENVAPPNELLPLLYLLARHALLLEFVGVGRRWLSGSFPTNKLDIELWGIRAQSNPPSSVFTVLANPPNVNSVYNQLSRNTDTQGKQIDPARTIESMRRALTNVSQLAVSDLERLMMESLDVASHRLDAWVTALASRRLSRWRGSQGESPQTNYFGAYGFVENVRPVARDTRLFNGGTVDVQKNNGGFVHAPSLRHASAAAILRSGRMAEKNNPTKYAIELPSERVRRARRLIDGVREGQALGALFGFELETRLRARAVAEHITGMEGYIVALRKLYPQVANKSGFDAGLPADRIAARNVVDGKLVRDAGATIPFGTGGLPGVGTTDAGVIADEVKRLDEIVDAVGDLVMSEAVYQIAAGDAVTAEAAMNFLPQGNNPPQPEITDSPATGIAVSHRVALLLEGDTPPASAWTFTESPRADADPFTEAWVGSLLGSPDDAKATITYQQGDQPATASFSIGQLQIGALDFLALAQSTSAAGQRSPLDRMIVHAFLGGTPGATDPEIAYDDPTPQSRSIPQLIELARALGAVLGGARELAGADLRQGQDAIDEVALGDKADELLTQATQAVVDLGEVRDALDGTNPQQALRDAVAYLADAFPDPDANPAALDLAETATRAELSRRANDAQAAVDAANAARSNNSNAAAIASAVQALRAVFGRNTLVVMPDAVPQGGDELRQSLLALASPFTVADPASFDKHQAPRRFLQQATRVHQRLGAWRRFSLYAGSFGAHAPLVSVAQLPFVTGEDWAGRAAPPASRTSLILVSVGGQTATPDSRQTWRGLLLDQWTELVPGAQAQTALAFHYDSQNAEAPQVILMAMHSGQPGGWNVTELSAIVNETMDLAQARPVDSDILALGQLVPPICVASNSENNIVSTIFGPEARQGPPVVG